MSDFVPQRIGNYWTQQREKAIAAAKKEHASSSAMPGESQDEDVGSLLVAVARTPQKVKHTNGFMLFKASDHPARPQQTGVRDGKGDVGAFAAACAKVYAELPDKEDFERRAKEINALRRAEVKERDDEPAT